MELDEFIGVITDSLYPVLKAALETGKLPDGRVLDASEKELLLRALLVYEANNLPEQQRIGYINREKSSPCQSDQESDDGDEAIIIRRD